MRAAGARRALGVALRVAGLTEGGSDGLALLSESVATLRRSPAVLERAHSLCELGAALRRAGQRADARGYLAEALDLAARCGARPGGHPCAGKGISKNAELLRRLDGEEGAGALYPR